MLYPIKFTPIYKEKIWGGQKLNTILNKDIPKNKNIGESWEISAVQDNLSVISNGFLQGNNIQELIEIYMGDLVGEKVYNKFGIEFPILIKFLEAADVLSIQVHPNNELAKKRHNAFGKNEMWYIIQAEKNAKLYFGFNKKITKKDYTESLEKQNIEQILHKEPAIKGSLHEIPAGRVHTIGKGILLAEIQQTSDITYRIHDWNRVDNKGNYRELHTDLALDAIDFNSPKNFRTEYKNEINKINEINRTKEFCTNYLKLDATIHRDYTKFDSFIIYMVLDGSCVIKDEFNHTETISKGETVLIPAELKNITIETNSVEIIEIYL